LLLPLLLLPLPLQASWSTGRVMTTSTLLLL
jgi:hypothetical protein